VISATDDLRRQAPICNASPCKPTKRKVTDCEELEGTERGTAQ